MASLTDVISGYEAAVQRLDAIGEKHSIGIRRIKVILEEADMLRKALDQLRVCLSNFESNRSNDIPTAHKELLPSAHERTVRIIKSCQSTLVSLSSRIQKIESVQSGGCLGSLTNMRISYHSYMISRCLRPLRVNRNVVELLVSELTPRTAGSDQVRLRTFPNGEKTPDPATLQRKVGSDKQGGPTSLQTVRKSTNETQKYQEIRGFGPGESMFSGPNHENNSPMSHTEQQVQGDLKDLSGQVQLKDGPPVAFGSLTSVHMGNWKGHLICMKVLKIRKNRANTAAWEAEAEALWMKALRTYGILTHPNILEVYGFANDIGDYPILVEKWCKNRDSANFLQSSSSVTDRDRFQLALGVAEGIAFLHSQQVVHGDLKPRNILISDSCTAQICDFGLSDLSKMWSTISTDTTSPYGENERYKAHELFPSRQNRNPKPSYESDIYSLGCVIHEFINRRRPFDELETLYDVLDAIKAKELPASPPKNLPVSKLWDLLEGCWNLNPLERPKAKVAAVRLKEIGE